MANLNCITCSGGEFPEQKNSVAGKIRSSLAVWADIATVYSMFLLVIPHIPLL